MLPLFNTVDLVDVTQEFLDKAKTYLGEEGKRVGNYICKGLQDFVPESGRYDVIWIQWVIGESVVSHVVFTLYSDHIICSHRSHSQRNDVPFWHVTTSKAVVVGLPTTQFEFVRSLPPSS